MKELIAALEAILEKGIVVEHIGWADEPVLIRLARDEDKQPESPTVIGGLGR